MVHKEYKQLGIRVEQLMAQALWWIYKLLEISTDCKLLVQLLGIGTILTEWYMLDCQWGILEI